jgi:hypothetical protein
MRRELLIAALVLGGLIPQAHAGLRGSRTRQYDKHELKDRILETLRARKSGPRMHFLTADLRQALPPAVLRNAKATARYQGESNAGTAFLVHRSGNRALMMTNFHVSGDQPGPFTHVVFEGWTRGKVLEVVAWSKELDYAIVDVELSEELQDLEPVTLARRFEHRPGARVYGMAGHAAEEMLMDGSGNLNRGLISVDEHSEGAVTDLIKQLELHTMAPGHVLPGSTRDRARSDLAAVEANSGGAICSGDTNHVVGLLSTIEVENGNTGYVRMDRILKDLSKQLHRRKIRSPSAARRLMELVASAE